MSVQVGDTVTWFRQMSRSPLTAERLSVVVTGRRYLAGTRLLRFKIEYLLHGVQRERWVDADSVECLTPTNGGHKK